jgi:hypothetical protein
VGVDVAADGGQFGVRGGDGVAGFGGEHGMSFGVCR